MNLIFVVGRLTVPATTTATAMAATRTAGTTNPAAASYTATVAAAGPAATPAANTARRRRKPAASAIAVATPVEVMPTVVPMMVIAATYDDCVTIIRPVTAIVGTVVQAVTRIAHACGVHSAPAAIARAIGAPAEHQR